MQCSALLKSLGKSLWLGLLKPSKLLFLIS